MRYLDEGAGPTVVCVHGNPTWSLYYVPLLRALSPDHRVIVPDHLGMGRSDHPPRDRYRYDLRARVDDFAALMDHLHVGVETPATLVVHDWGGAIALTWAARHPGRVGRLVITNTAAFPLLAGQRLPWLLRPARVPLLGDALVRGANAFVHGTLRLGVRRGRLPASVRRALAAPYGSARRRVGVLEFVRDVPAGPGGDTHALLAETATGLHRLADRPAQIVVGSARPCADPALPRRVAPTPARRRGARPAGCRPPRPGRRRRGGRADRGVPGAHRPAGARRAVSAPGATRPDADGSTPPALLAGLAAAARDTARREAVVMADGRRMTFAALADRVTNAAAGLRSVGVADGARAALLTPPGPDFVVATFALLAAGAVPVLIDPGIGVRRARAALAEVAPTAFVGSPRAHVARRVLGLAGTATALVLTETDAAPTPSTGRATRRAGDAEPAPPPRSTTR